jgi:hypothetical protein
MPSKLPRCKNGYNRKPAKTGICVKKGVEKIDAIKKEKKTLKKTCPQGKLLNPKTNRCINDTLANRKRLNMPLNKVSNKVEVNKDDTSISTVHCKKYDNIREMDLNRLSVTVIPNSSGFKIDYTVTNKKFPLDNIQFLSSGSYGEVYKFSRNDYGIAVKTYKSDDDDEIGIINMLEKKKIPCEIVNSKLLKVGNRYICAMELMAGALSKMNGKLNVIKDAKCIKSIAKHLKCLNDHGLSYTDLKCDNVLFKCIDNKNIKTVLGDIGGICKRGQMHISTWTPWEYRNEVGHVKCCEPTMVWCLGVILTELFGTSTTIFYWDNIYKYDIETLKGYIETVCRYKRLSDVYVDKAKIHSLEQLYKDMLDLNPKKRIKLKDIISRIDI